MNYAKAIRTIRAARGLSQKDLAARLKIDPSYVSLIEAGKRVPSISVLEDISKALDVPIYLLMLLSSEKDDLRGISEDDAKSLGKQLLEAVLEAQKKHK